MPADEKCTLASRTDPSTPGHPSNPREKPPAQLPSKGAHPFLTRPAMTRLEDSCCILPKYKARARKLVAVPFGVSSPHARKPELTARRSRNISYDCRSIRTPIYSAKMLLRWIRPLFRPNFDQ